MQTRCSFSSDGDILADSYTCLAETHKLHQRCTCISWHHLETLGRKMGGQTTRLYPPWLGYGWVVGEKNTLWVGPCAKMARHLQPYFKPYVLTPFCVLDKRHYCFATWSFHLEHKLQMQTRCSFSSDGDILADSYTCLAETHKLHQRCTCISLASLRDTW